MKTDDLDEIYLKYADKAKRQCRVMIGEQGLKHLSVNQKALVESYFKIQHGSP